MMEKEFYRDEFEHLLKDTTDDFKMYPSRKVWHSIYNDLHPDRKWPSMAVCLLLLTGIMYVGVSNNNAINNETRKNSATLALNKNTQNITAVDDQKSIQQPPVSKAAIVRNIEKNKIVVEDIYRAENPRTSNVSAATDENIFTERVVVNNIQTDISNTDQTTTLKVPTLESKEALTNAATAKVVKMPAFNSEKFATEVSVDDPQKTTEAATAFLSNKSEEYTDDRSTFKNFSLSTANKNFANNTRELEWVEDFALHNKPEASKKLFKGLSTLFYITPSVGYRVMFKNRKYEKLDNLIASNATGNYPEQTEFNQQAALSLEIGGGITKDITKRLRVKTGMQFNVTDYITYAKKLSHPAQTTIVVDNFNTGISLAPTTADFANMPGKNSTKLHNRTVQLSIPLGVDYKILSNKKLSWYVGTSFQPTYVVDGSSYLISSDNSYLIEGVSMMRKWNLNGAIESFVTFKTKSNTLINLGPQFRYQLMSTYNKSYIYTEKPYSVGLKIGITRPL